MARVNKQQQYMMAFTVVSSILTVILSIAVGRYLDRKPPLTQA